MDENALQCPNCGVAVLASASYCINCGIRLPDWEAVNADVPVSDWGEPPAATDEPVIALGFPDDPGDDELDTAAAWLEAEADSASASPAVDEADPAETDGEPVDDASIDDETDFEIELGDAGEALEAGPADGQKHDAPLDSSGTGAELEDLVLPNDDSDRFVTGDSEVFLSERAANLWLVSSDDDFDDDEQAEIESPGDDLPAEELPEPYQRAEALIDELRALLPRLADRASPAGDVGDLHQAVVAARGARSFDDFAALREVIGEAVSRPRDIEIILRLSQRVEDMAALLAERDRLHEALDTIVARLDAPSEA